MIKLRNFLYLNTKVVEDYISVIEGLIYDEESYEIEHANENLVEGNLSIKFFSENGTHSTKETEVIFK